MERLTLDNDIVRPEWPCGVIRCAAMYVRINLSYTKRCPGVACEWRT
jgi:hypothetical protein